MEKQRQNRQGTQPAGLGEQGPEAAGTAGRLDGWRGPRGLRERGLGLKPRQCGLQQRNLSFP